MFISYAIGTILVRCKWFRMGAIVSTVKRNNCKTPLREEP